MDRDQLIAEIKKQLLEELNSFTQPLVEKIPEAQKNQVLEIKNEVNDFVEKNPMLALGIAGIAGFFIARLLYKKGGE